MEPVLTPTEMAAADARTIGAGTPVEVLMDRAGRAVAWAVRRRLDGVYGKHVVAVCGKGNNGGDGRIAARVLRGWGVGVDEFLLESGVDRRAFERALARADAAIDAMYGTGFKGALAGDAAWIAEQLRAVEVVAVDVPSGVNGLTGAVEGVAVRADETVCFAALKSGLCFEPGRSYAGRLTVVDIGIDIGVASSDGWSLPLGIVERADVAPLITTRAADAHKWRTGVLVIGGSGGMIGAPLLVSHAAMRAGAGIVWCGVPGDAAARTASGSEVITKALPATRGGALADEVLKLPFERFAAVVVGPGLGTHAQTAQAVRRLVSEVPVPLVLDADGLNALHGDPELLQQRPAATVVTPHEGEYERLMGQPVGEHRVDAARRLAAAANCVALLKGPGTVVAHPDGRAVVVPTGGRELATAGSGDVLSGVIGGVLAGAGLPYEATAAAAYVHGYAGRLAAPRGAVAPVGVVASDLVAALPRTLAEIQTDPLSFSNPTRPGM